MVSVPKELMLAWMIRLETEYMVDCRPAGSPIRMMADRMLGEKRISRRYSRYMSSVFISAYITMAALATWDREVAMATPATPMRRTRTKNRSSTILVSVDAIRK